MTKKDQIMKPEKSGYYWVNTAGYHNSQAPMYWGVDGWKLELGDSHKFVSHRVLESIYGKNCVIREVDFEKDVLDLNTDQADEKIMLNTLNFIVMKSDNGEPVIMNYYPAFRMMNHNGMLILLRDNDFSYLVYKQNSLH